MLFPSKPCIQFVDKHLLSTYYCPSTYHGARTVLDVMCSEWDRIGPLPSWSFQFRIKCKGQVYKIITYILRRWSIFSLKFNVIIMHRALAIPTKTYEIASSEFLQKHIPPLPMQLGEKIK